LSRPDFQIGTEGKPRQAFTEYLLIYAFSGVNSSAALPGKFGYQELEERLASLAANSPTTLQIRAEAFNVTNTVRYQHQHVGFF
jgi:hypothetical protein